MNGGVFDNATVAFAARTYRIISLSACIGSWSNASVAETIMGVAARLKAANAAVKVLMYWNTQQWACYNAGEPAFAAFLARPDWWLRNDAGGVVTNNGSPQYDWTVAGAVDNFLAMPVSRAAGGAPVLDGFLLDGAAVYQPEAGVSAARAEAQKAAKWAAVGRLQARLTALNDGLVLANGMVGGPIDPFAPNDAFNLGVLAFSGAVENERGSPSFGQVDQLGAMRKDAVAANLAAIENATAIVGGTRVIAASYWPGPIVGFPGPTSTTPRWWPLYAAGDRANSAPNGTTAQIVAGWTALLDKWLPFNLALFLSVAGPTSYFSQMVWYASFQGFAPCPKTPGTCVDPLYDALNRPLGVPLGPRKQVGAYKWVRTFEHAVVTLDLDDPLGPGTSIVARSSGAHAVSAGAAAVAVAAAVLALTADF